MRKSTGSATAGTTGCCRTYRASCCGRLIAAVGDGDAAAAVAAGGYVVVVVIPPGGRTFVCDPMPSGGHCRGGRICAALRKSLGMLLLKCTWA